MSGDRPAPDALLLAAQTRLYFEDMAAVCDQIRTVLPTCHDPHGLHLLCSTLIQVSTQRVAAALDLSMLERVLGDDYRTLVTPADVPEQGGQP